MKKFNSARALSDLSSTQAGQRIIAHANKAWGGHIESAINDAWDGCLGTEASTLADSLPSYWEEAEPTAEEAARLAAAAKAAADYQAVIDSRRADITAAVIAAIKTGECVIVDTGTNSVSETTIRGKNRLLVAVLPHYDARLGGMGFKVLDTPVEAQKFIDSAAINASRVVFA